MKLYAYCLSDEVTAQSLESVVGLADGAARLIRWGEIAAVVTEFAADTVAVTRENVLAHERVVRRVLTETTPLPFRFGTLVSELRLQNYVETQQASLKAQLARVRDCIEMSVKVIWHPEAVRQESLGLNGQSETHSSASPLKVSGTEFLNAKRREILGDELLKKRAAEVSDWLAESLGDTVREAEVNVQPKESLVLAAAHLVGRERLKEYHAALRRARAARPELHFLTSGAWPPYSFTNICS